MFSFEEEESSPDPLIPPDSASDRAVVGVAVYVSSLRTLLVPPILSIDHYTATVETYSYVWW